MGTRSVIKFYQGNSEEKDSRFLGAIYQQFDGYPDGVGYKLAKFLNKIELINGIQKYDNIGVQANGMGCLVAQFVKLNKRAIGGFYMTSEDDSQEWDYIVRNNWGENEFNITVKDRTGVVFEGNEEMFFEFCGGSLDKLYPPENEDLIVVD